MHKEILGHAVYLCTCTCIINSYMKGQKAYYYMNQYLQNDYTIYSTTYQIKIKWSFVWKMQPGQGRPRIVMVEIILDLRNVGNRSSSQFELRWPTEIQV